jgi:hypothetical protein
MAGQWSSPGAHSYRPEGVLAAGGHQGLGCRGLSGSGDLGRFTAVAVANQHAEENSKSIKISLD